jgi:hypothetical protein
MTDQNSHQTGIIETLASASCIPVLTGSQSPQCNENGYRKANPSTTGRYMKNHTERTRFHQYTKWVFDILFKQMILTGLQILFALNNSQIETFTTPASFGTHLPLEPDSRTRMSHAWTFKGKTWYAHASELYPILNQVKTKYYQIQINYHHQILCDIQPMNDETDRYLRFNNNQMTLEKKSPGHQFPKI